MRYFNPIIFLAILLSFIFGVWKLTEYAGKSNRQAIKSFEQPQAGRLDTTATDSMFIYQTQSDSVIDLGQFFIQ